MVIFGYFWLFLVIFGYFWLSLVIFVRAIVLTTCFVYRDAAEFGKIGRYYAAESMLVMDQASGEYDASTTPSYGTDTLEAFFKKVSVEGLAGQELGDQAVFKSKD